jgi:peptide subunit release factor 1 (eRF1)
MITREELRQLAEVESKENAAVTFYYQPRPPQNKSHREEAILVKDLVKQAVHQAHGANGARPDLNRILEMSEQLHGNHARAKAVFACSAQGVWREFDLPPLLPATQLVIDHRFHLRPIATLGARSPRCCVTLVDREKARLFTLRAGDLSERTGLFDVVPRRGRTDGFLGYDAGHKERHIDNETMRHFKHVAERLRDLQAREGCEAFIVGCRDETWPELVPHLHVYIRQRLIGRFSVDPVLVTLEEIKEQAERVLHEHDRAGRQELIREVLGEAQRNARGTVGLRHVLQSMERGEVQTLLIGQNFAAKAVECSNCSHLDTRMVKSCAVCGHETRELDDVADALVRRALRGGLDYVYLEDEALEKAGNIGALLRFRADQNTPQKQAG